MQEERQRGSRSDYHQYIVMMIRVIRMIIVIIMMVIVSLAGFDPMFHKFLISRGQNGEEEVESTSLGPGDMPTGKDIT